MVKRMLWERRFVAKAVVAVDSRVWPIYDLCHNGDNGYSVRLVSWYWGFDMDFKDFCGEKKETSKIEFEL